MRISHPQLVVRGTAMYNTMTQYLLKYLATVIAGIFLAFSPVQEGSIKGTVIPAEASAVVWTVAGSDTLRAAADPTSGEFEITGVPVGQYVLHIDGTKPWESTTVNVTVNDGQVSDVGEVALEKPDE